MGRGWVAGCRGGVAVVSRLSRWCHFLSNRRRLPRNWPDGGVISGVATVITCIARHKALSRLAGAAVKQMAAHDGRDVHVSAHPAAQTPIDSGVCESFERSAWCHTQQCPGALRRSARRRQGLATPATRMRRAAPLSSWRAGHERQSVSGSGSGSAGPPSTCFVWKPFLLRPSDAHRVGHPMRINAETQSSMAPCR